MLTVMLPDELWEHVFYHASDNPARRQWEGPIDIPPFHVYSSARTEDVVRDALRTKVAISVVSSSWRRLSAKFLYEDISVRQGSEASALALLKLESGGQDLPGARIFGHFARRVTLG